MKILKNILKIKSKNLYLYYFLMPLMLVAIAKFSLIPQVSWIGSYILIAGANTLTFMWIKDHVRLFRIHSRYFWMYAAIQLLTTAFFPVTYSLFGLYGLPVFFGVLTVSSMAGSESGVAMAVTLSTVAAVMGGGNFELFAVYTIGSISGVYLAKNLNKRFDFSKAALGAAAVSVLMLFTMSFAFPTSQIGFNDLLTLGLNPFVSMILMLGILPYAEYLSRIYSNVGLIELGNLGHPLLKRLSVKAPGTYFHSVMLSNMSEAAAQRIGSNYVLARVGPYFHDIGKTKRPEFFTENQQGVNPHDAMSPMMNYLVVTSHVKYGAEIARKYKLPLLVEDMIKEHHGTRMASFFYQKALSENIQVSPDDFRYPGPRPRTKESGIVMLADSCEAAVRSLKDPNPSKIQGMVEDVVNRIYNERQLDDSGLTLKDIDEIVQEFSKVLSAKYKMRIEYPKSKDDVEKVIKIARM